MDSASPSQTPTTSPPDDLEKTAENPDSDAGALESSSPEDTAASVSGSSSDTSGMPVPPPKKQKGLKAFISKFNLYLLLFVFIFIMAGVILGIAYLQGKKNNTSSIKSQDLTESTLQQLASSDATVGDPKQVLNIESNAVFAGKVLVRDSLEVAGGLQVGGGLTLDSVTVSGDGNFGQEEVSKNLSVGGNTGIQGQVTIGQGLQVNGTGTFTGTVSAPELTASILQLNGDLTLTHHIVAGGPSPSSTQGPALGNGGTATVGGSDTSGSASINTGSSPVIGCFVTITFASKFSSTPRVMITPVGSGGAGLAYYVNRSSTNFSICDADTPPAGTSFSFDYFVVD